MGGQDATAGDRWLRDAAALRALAAALTNDASEADDLVQETWLRGHQVAVGAADARSWLSMILRNLVRDRHREKSRRSRTEREAARGESLPSEVEVLERLETANRLTAEVARLDEPYRSAIHLRYFEGLRPEEIAERSGAPLETVRSRLRRGLVLLRGRMDRAFGGDRQAWSVSIAAISAPSKLSTLELASGGLVSVGAIVMSAKIYLGVAAAIVIGLAAFLLRPGQHADIPGSTVLGGAAPSPTALGNAGISKMPDEEQRRIQAQSGKSETTDSSLGSDSSRYRQNLIIVLDEDSVPLANATVTCSNCEEATPITTDVAGQCTIGAPRDGSYVRLKLDHEGYVHVSTESYNQPELTFRLKRAVTLAGQVRDADTDQPIAAARVAQIPMFCRDCTPVWIDVNESGQFDLTDFPFDKGMIQIAASGYPLTFEQVELNSTSDRAARVFKISRGIQVRGRVVDYVTRRGLPEASACEFSFDAVPVGADGSFVVLARPNSEGLIRVQATCPGRCQLTATMPVTQVAINGIELPLPASPILVGVVRDAEGSPVAGASVSVRGDTARRQPAKKQSTAPAGPSLEAPPGFQYEGYRASATTNDSGEFQLVGLVPWADSAEAVVSKQGFDRRITPLATLPGPGESMHVDLQIKRKPGAVVQGSVWLNGQPIACDVKWEVGRASGTTISSWWGKYTLEEVPSGRLVVKVSIQGGVDGLEGSVFESELREGDNIHHDFEMRSATSPITGIVRLTNGTPIAGAIVRAQVTRTDKNREDTLRLASREVRTALDGSFELTVPDSELAFTVSAMLGAAVAKQEVKPGSRGVVLELACSGSLRLRAIDARTRAVVSPAALFCYAKAPREQYSRELDFPSSPDTDEWSSIPIKEGPLQLRIISKHGDYQAWGCDTDIPCAGETRIDCVLEPALSATIALQSSAEEDARLRIFVVEPEAWDDVREWKDDRGNHYDGGPLLPGGTMFSRCLVFDAEGRAKVGGLSPGRYLFKVLPEHFPLEPEGFEIGAGTEQPIVVKRKR